MVTTGNCCVSSRVASSSVRQQSALTVLGRSGVGLRCLLAANNRQGSPRPHVAARRFGVIWRLEAPALHVCHYAIYSALRFECDCCSPAIVVSWAQHVICRVSFSKKNAAKSPDRCIGNSHFTLGNPVFSCRLGSTSSHGVHDLGFIFWCHGG